MADDLQDLLMRSQASRKIAGSSANVSAFAAFSNSAANSAGTSANLSDGKEIEEHLRKYARVVGIGEPVNWAASRAPENQSFPEELETQALLNLPALQPEELCTSCSSIPFRFLGFHGKIQREEFERQFPKDRPLPEVFKNLNGCFFCQKIASLFRNWNRQKCGNIPLSKLGRITVEINPHWLPSVEADGKGYCEGVLLRIGIEFMFWDFTLDGHIHSPNFDFQRCNKPLLKVSDFCMNQNAEEPLSEVAQPYCGRIRPLTADFGIFQKWKDLCKSQHGRYCDTLFTGDHLNRIRLIDVERECIVDAPRGLDYVALSYVWGGVPRLRLERSNIELLQQPGTLRSETLPATIADAAKVTLGLGERYLWVDSLCIIQDDDADKQYFIPNMDSVYGCALVTIIALSGERLDEGLPGIRPGSRCREEEPFTIATTPVIACLDPARKTPWSNYLGDSTWDHRAWTFQERIFSRRALIFASEQIYWECQKGSWCEDGIWEVLKSPHIHRMAFNSANFLLPKLLNLDEFAKKYGLLVEKYSLRKLSFESDVLNAFAGILHALERIGDQTFFWGLPLSLFSSALQWKADLGENLKRRVTSAPYKTEDGSTISLPIPSWTWAGWENGISMPNFDSRGMAIEVKFYRMTSSGQLVEIQESNEQQIRSEHDTLRQKWKKTGDAAVEVGDIPREALNHPSRLSFLSFWSCSAALPYLWVVLRGDIRPTLGFWGDRKLRSFWMQPPTRKPTIGREINELERGEIVCEEVGEFIVVGRDMHSYSGGCGDMLMLMLIERQGEIVYRRGLTSVAEEDWIEVNHDWKLFVLG